MIKHRANALMVMRMESSSYNSYAPYGAVPPFVSGRTYLFRATKKIVMVAPDILPC